MGFEDESDRLKEIQQIVGPPSAKVIHGFGEDATVAKISKAHVVTAVQTLFEGVHFDLLYTTPFELGYKSLAVVLSEMAAMGALPRIAIPTVGIRQETSAPFLREFYRGIRKLAESTGVDVIGTYTVPSPSTLMVNVVAVGEPHKKLLGRGGARKGNVLAVTGSLGASAAGLRCLKKLGREKLHGHTKLIQAHLMPEPKLKISKILAQSGAVTALIDLGDGLVWELHRMLEASNVGALIEEQKVPISSEAIKGAKLLDMSPAKWAFYGGEDYELLCAVKASEFNKLRKKIQAMKKNLYAIGRVESKKHGIVLKDKQGEQIPLDAREWHPFVRRG